MLTITKERVAVVAATMFLLWSCGPTPPHIAAAVAGIVFFWWFVGPRVSSKADRDPETPA